MVGLGGLEPPTSHLSGAHSNQLSYKPPQEIGKRGRLYLRLLIVNYFVVNLGFVEILFIKDFLGNF